MCEIKSMETKFPTQALELYPFDTRYAAMTRHAAMMKPILKIMGKLTDGYIKINDTYFPVSIDLVKYWMEPIRLISELSTEVTNPLYYEQKNGMVVFTLSDVEENAFGILYEQLINERTFDALVKLHDEEQIIDYIKALFKLVDANMIKTILGDHGNMVQYAYQLFDTEIDQAAMNCFLSHGMKCELFGKLIMGKKTPTYAKDIYNYLNRLDFLWIDMKNIPDKLNEILLQDCPHVTVSDLAPHGHPDDSSESDDDGYFQNDYGLCGYFNGNDSVAGEDPGNGISYKGTIVTLIGISLLLLQKATHCYKSSLPPDRRPSALIGENKILCKNGGKNVLLTYLDQCCRYVPRPL